MSHEQLNNIFFVNSNLKIIFLLFLIFSKISNIQTHIKRVFGLHLRFDVNTFLSFFFIIFSFQFLTK